jgi:hypothetical protein
LLGGFRVRTPVRAPVEPGADQRADRRPNGEATKQLGVLLASGLIVGESLLGVVVAALVAFSDKLGFANHDAPLALVGEGFSTPAIWIGGIAFVACIVVMYRWIARMGRNAS